MSLFLPFSHRPTSVIANPTSYTCPAGKYARITGTLSTNATATGTALLGGAANGTIFDTETNAGNTSFEFWVDVGDVVTKQTDNIVGSQSSLSGATFYTAADTGYARVLINGTVTHQVLSSAVVSYNGQGGTSIQVAGTSSVNIMIEEYDIA